MILRVLVLLLSFSVPLTVSAEDIFFFLKNSSRPTPSAVFNRLSIDLDILNDERPFLSVYDPVSGEECFVEVHYDFSSRAYHVFFNNLESEKTIKFRSSQFMNWSRAEDKLNIQGNYELIVRKDQNGVIKELQLSGHDNQRVAGCRYQ